MGVGFDLRCSRPVIGTTDEVEQETTVHIEMAEDFASERL